VVKLVAEAPAQETRIQNYAERWADDLVPYSFIGAGASGLLGGGLQGAASMLIVDYGTGIRIAAPTTVLASMTKAVRNGILIKGGRYLEKLAEVDAIVFDKTGTLTSGHPEIVEVRPHNGYTLEEVLSLAAAAEQRFTHPVAKAVVRAAKAKGVYIPERSTSAYAIGLGVESAVNGYMVLVGSPRFMTQKGVHLPKEVQKDIRAILRRAASPLCVAADGIIYGILASADPIRPEAPEVIQALRQRGIREIVMLTGDHHRVAEQVAEGLGLSRYVAEVFPAEKAEIVRRLQKEGRKVAVVGDGINDSPALAYADVGIAVDGGTDVARETAHVVLLQGGLWKIPLAIDVCREAMELIRQNWDLIAVPNTIALGLAFCGFLGPGATTLLSNGSAIVATANALRPVLTKDVRGAPRSSAQRPVRPPTEG
jgi:heavy metal translocating P-type ATPase